ncbi:beta-hexosaminidase [Litorimonas cladophorae]|uniref:beta-N-acetylhexosaminidase n=1 Tax=Litorimonas cladophorae TaxID=1220491 RepID=A0A918KE92_9PROT|nr:beta-N-acetylhexosaminidase [Litorimonas cladophorae]GGX58172.1 beta-hexosaminidase [Litorimonas cladophorae]
MAAPLSCILGLSDTRLKKSESLFLRDANPWGVILFKRNVENPDQLRKLTGDIRDAMGRNTLIFVDQEGGRVQRLRAPHWRAYPSGDDYATIYRADRRKGLRACYLGHRLIADDLRAVGITSDCAPVLDLPQPGSDPIISDRALGNCVEHIIDMAHAAMSGLMSGGVAPVVKHIPGHGRATVDSHKALPKIDADRATLEASDFLPFRRLNDAPMAMTAHAVYSHNSRSAVTISKRSLTELIREGIGFDGLLMSDDLDMKALKGDLTLKTQRALNAGCDIALQCSGALADGVNVAKGAMTLSGRALMRATIADNCADVVTEFDRAPAEAEFDTLMSAVAT